MFLVEATPSASSGVCLQQAMRVRPRAAIHGPSRPQASFCPWRVGSRRDSDLPTQPCASPVSPMPPPRPSLGRRLRTRVWGVGSPGARSPGGSWGCGRPPRGPERKFVRVSPQHGAVLESSSVCFERFGGPERFSPSSAPLGTASEPRHRTPEASDCCCHRGVHAGRPHPQNREPERGREKAPPQAEQARYFDAMLKAAQGPGQEPLDRGYPEARVQAAAKRPAPAAPVFTACAPLVPPPAEACDVVGATDPRGSAGAVESPPQSAPDTCATRLLSTISARNLPKLCRHRTTLA